MSSRAVEVNGLTVAFGPASEPVYALRNVSLTLRPGAITGIVGESGSGKSTLALALIGLLPKSARVETGSVRVGGHEFIGMPEESMRRQRGSLVSMVFQDPMTSLNPARSIGGHLLDAQHRDRTLPKADRIARAIDVLRRVGVPDPAEQLRRFPHHLSGGMRQRIVIAMALLGKPLLLIADEPTTALDVTIEAQILHLLRELQREIDGSIAFISHSLGAVAEVCDQVVVMYAGQVVEEGPVRSIFHKPAHPYTRALLDCDPSRIAGNPHDLPSIPGEPPATRVLSGPCSFAPRCSSVMERCRMAEPAWLQQTDGRGARCYLAGDAS